ncbi:hypothetical protein B0H10DRAFT_2440305 [Mycena sp. CBHHK59/15]|nr:hypothetical protein B0H10DRAFT_2440305 [Mycena sp. CBHHK59/15]
MPPKSAANIVLDARLAAAMLAASPVPLAPPGHRKRKCTNTDEQGDTENGLGSDEDDSDDELPTTITPTSASAALTSGALTSGSSASNRNVLTFTKQYATTKCLRPSQITGVEAFAGDSVATRQIKLFALSLSLKNKMEQIVSTRPDFKVSLALDKNIHQIALGILTSSRLAAYKGSLPTKHLLNILIKNRFDLPPGIEFIASDWALVKSRAEHHLTQVRALFKRFLKQSLPEGPPSAHLNIFVLGQHFVKDTKTVLTVLLCARIALMREIYVDHPGEEFWDELDSRLSWMRTTAGMDDNKIIKMFKLVLNDDCAAHGVSSDYTLPEDAVVDQWQLSVDNAIDADTVSA